MESIPYNFCILYYLRNSYKSLPSKFIKVVLVLKPYLKLLHFFSICSQGIQKMLECFGSKLTMSCCCIKHFANTVNCRLFTSLYCHSNFLRSFEFSRHVLKKVLISIFKWSKVFFKVFIYHASIKKCL